MKKLKCNWFTRRDSRSLASNEDCSYIYVYGQRSSVSALAMIIMNVPATDVDRHLHNLSLLGLTIILMIIFVSSMKTQPAKYKMYKFVEVNIVTKTVLFKC